jgi:CRISPR type IV-associated protein Csf3
MKNLKITFNLSTPLVMDRFTTIDGILLKAYYAYLKKNGKILPFDKDHKSVKFIEQQKGIFSGSVWFLDKNSDVFFDFVTITKKVEDKKIYDLTEDKVKSNSLYKQALITFETINTDKIYFYIRAEREITEALLSQIKFIGKNANLGYGKVKNIEIEEIKEDKGFFLKEDIVAKPLDCDAFTVKSKAIAFYRTKPPYWSLEDLKACYMPSNMLLEEFIETDKNIENYKTAKMDYIDNCTFLFENRNKTDEYKDIKLEDIKFPKKIKYEILDHNTSLRCSFTQQIHARGIACDVKKFIKYYKRSWGDWQYILTNDFISYEVLWAIEKPSMDIIGYSLVDTKEWVFVQGKNTTENTMLKNYIVDTDKFRVPFSLNLKDTKNAQHVSFKGRVNISNAFFFIQYGDETLNIDAQTLNMARNEIEQILKENKDISKTHLTGNYRDNYYPMLKRNKNEEVNQKIIMEFQKKYSQNVRKLLSLVAY